MKLLSFALSGIFIIFWGFLIKEKKLYQLIAGYSRLSEEQKEKGNINKIAKRIGILCYFIGGMLLGLGILLQFTLIKPELLFAFFSIIFVVSVDFIMFLINKNNITKGLIIIIGITNILFLGLIFIPLFVL